MQYVFFCWKAEVYSGKYNTMQYIFFCWKGRNAFWYESHNAICIFLLEMQNRILVRTTQCNMYFSDGKAELYSGKNHTMQFVFFCWKGKKCILVSISQFIMYFSVGKAEPYSGKNHTMQFVFFCWKGRTIFW